MSLDPSWTAVVGFSGTGKTPGIDATKRALSQIERSRRDKIAELKRAHEGRVETAKAARAQWKKDLKRVAEGKIVRLGEYRSKVASEPVMPPEAADPGPFVAPRLYVSNATIERLAALLQARPQGMLMLSDELAGLFLNMSRYSGGQDNEFWLEAWDGGPYTVERVGRPPIVLRHLLIGVVGGLQPDKLARSFKGDLDGMYARILFTWPVDPSYRPLTNEVAEVEPEIVNALSRIIDLECGDANNFAPRDVALSSEAIEAFERFRQFQHSSKDGLDGREREWWAKSPAHVLRLAGTLCYLSWAMEGGSEPKQIELEYRTLSHASQVSRCGAKTRAGTSCQSPPVRGRKRCRLHGGLSPGAPRGNRNGNYTNGEWTAEAIEERRWLRSLVRDFAKTSAI